MPLSKIMQSISSRYTKHINRKIDKNGRLFQGRYKSKPIYSVEYLVQLCYYIHRNPVSANMVKAVGEYPWSSHHCYMKTKTLPWVTTDYIFDLLTSRLSCAQNQYFCFISKDSNELFQQKIFDFNDSGVLISVDKMVSNIDHPQMKLTTLTLDQIAYGICEFFNVSPHMLEGPSQMRRLSDSRNMITYFAYYCGTYQLKEIAVYLDRTPESLSRCMHRALAKNKAKINISILEKRLKKLCLLHTDTFPC